MPMKYQHLFFDLDHTLWDFDTNSKITMEALYHQYHLAGLGIHSFDNFYEKYHQHNQRLWDRYTKGFIKQEELRWKRMWLALLDFKIADEALARKMSVEYLHLLPHQKTLFPNCLETLDYLKTKGYPMSLITNGFDLVQHNKLQHSGLTNYFNKVITSEACNAVKPNKEIFDYACEQTGALANNSVMIGDNLDADIQGGINAGMDTIFVNHLQITPTVSATYVVYDLLELKSIL